MTKRIAHGEVTLEIDATPAEVYGLISRHHADGGMESRVHSLPAAGLLLPRVAAGAS
jgi:hypothetical protein